jgi:hypothetical protein
MAPTKGEQEIIALEERFWNGIRDGDAAAASSMIDNACLVTGGQGHSAIDQKMFAGMMQAPKWKLHDYKFEKPIVIFPAEDVAIIAYKVIEHLTVEGKPLTLEASDASTWVRHDGRWRCALHTESVLGDPFGRDRRP